MYDLCLKSLIAFGFFSFMSGMDFETFDGFDIALSVGDRLAVFRVMALTAQCYVDCFNNIDIESGYDNNVKILMDLLSNVSDLMEELKKK